MSKEFENNTNEITLKNSIFRIGCVFSVDGREVKIQVDKRKNSSHLLYKGDLLKNVSVGGYAKIVKGFISIIAKVEGEYIKEDKYYDKEYGKVENKIDRILRVQLLGYIENGKFERGIKELPLIDNECYLLDKEEFETIHDFVNKNDRKIKIGTLALERGQEIKLGVNSLFASHIGIFGNTGSGKSYTLAKLYRLLFEEFRNQKAFKANAKFILFDFNGEYNKPDSIISDKKVYNLSTKNIEKKDRLPFLEKDLLNIELFSILSNATEKTQQPFLKRALSFFNVVQKSDDPIEYFRNILRKKVQSVLEMTDKNKAYLLLDYIRAILPNKLDSDGIEISLSDDFAWHGQKYTFYKIPIIDNCYFDQKPQYIRETKLYKHVDEFVFDDNYITRIISFLYLQLIHDVINNRAQNEHIAPVINKLKSFQKDIESVIEIKQDEKNDFWDNKFFSVINLNDVNLNMKKLIPLLISFKLYSEHKKNKHIASKSLNIIIDEAHNILSYSSERESETWKDYRLETFEEIIKEGRKFGVFITIASQRPSDISTTIISQLHNYFIHRLINERDIEAVGRTISYLDKVSHESLPILPTGSCVIAGLTAQVPVIVCIDEIEKIHEPDNKTINLLNNWVDVEFPKEPDEDPIESEEVYNSSNEDDLPF